MDDIGGFERVPLPRHREVLGDLASLIPRHSMQGAVEFDVTKARTLMRKHKEETGDTLSFMAWLIKCIAQAVSEYKHVQAYRKGKSLIIFQDVDVGFTMEQESGGIGIVSGYIVRKANEKSFRNIHEEVRSAQMEKGIHGALIGSRDDARTDIWGLPLVSGPYSLFFGVGAIAKKPGLIDDRIEPRDYLPVSVMFDHDAVDGADAARFIARLGELLREGHDLC